MTDAEILKALEGCSNWESDKTCDECPANTYGFGCAHKMAKHTLDLINRQEAEIERLRHSIKLLEKDVKGAKDEGAKEFAKFLIDTCGDAVVLTRDLHDYVIEMESESDAEE